MIGGAVIADESILPTFGDEALGMVTPLMYSAALDTPANRQFVADYRKKYGKVPSYFSETCYTSARWINEAAKRRRAAWRTARSSWPRSARSRSRTRRAGR